MLKRARKRPKTPVEEMSLQEFFAELTDEPYRKLRDVIEKNLSDVKVFKVGQRKVSVYIVGKTDEGDWAGLKTTAVET